MRGYVLPLILVLFLSITAVYMSGQVYGYDILTGGTASANSVFAAQSADNACDDNEGTYWSNNNDGVPSWWKYDLGVGIARIVTKLRLKPAYSIPSGIRVKDFKIQGSNNNVDWDDISTEQHAENADWEDYTFSNFTAYRYYRLYITSNWDASDWVQIWEIEMMETRADAVFFGMNF